jgi:subtilisin family serine protease
MLHLGARQNRSLDLIRKAGAEVLANYGQSVLVRCDDKDLKRLVAEGLRVRELEDTNVVDVGGFRVDTGRPEIQSTSARAVAASLSSGVSHHVIRLSGPMHPDWRTRLEKLGVVFHQSLADDSYLAGVATNRVDDVRQLPFVEAVVPYTAPMKVNPALLTTPVRTALAVPAALMMAIGEQADAPQATAKPQIYTAPRASRPAADEETGNVEVVLYRAADLLRVADAIRDAGAKIVQAEGNRLTVLATAEEIARIAEIPEVREVNPFQPRKLHNNVATGILHADTVQTANGLDGTDQIVGIADTGLDTGVNDATMLDDFEGRVVSIFALGRPGDASDTQGHGTHVAGSVLGNGTNSSGMIRGTAYNAQVVFQSIMDATGGLGGIPADLGVGLFDVARDQGARIHTNSWGADVNGAYNTDSTNADKFAFENREMLIVFSAGNDAPNRVGAPGTAKNVLTVGASESNRVLPAAVNFPASPMFPGGATATGMDTQADDVNEVAAFSSVGPAQNTRRKPDVIAPGSWILSTRSSVAVYDSGPDGLGPGEVPPNGTGDEDGVETHAEAVGLGLPGQPILRAGDQNTPAAPPGSGALATDNYMYLGGTSMATPLTAGASALVRQYLVQQRGHTPSGALVKAFMVNGAIDIGLGVPNDSQGWGRVDLTNTLFPAGTGRVQFDDSLDNAVATGDIRTYDVLVSSAANPLTVTLVWRDPQGNTIQNRLHLRVTEVASATTFTADAIGTIRNNVQKVIVNAPAPGLWQIEVEGVNVVTGISELLPAVRQDYALVVSNATGFSCNPSDIVQVIDRSGSMGFSGYMEPAKERAKQMIDLMQINDQAGVVTFASAAGVAFPLTLIDNQSVKDDAHAVIDPVTAGGSTDLREALEDGAAALGADVGRPRAIVFLSDGFHTVATPAIDDPFLDTIAAQNIKVYTIALGPDSDFAVLNNIANRTGTGAVNTVESSADLHKLHEIYYSIIGGVGCGGVIHLNSTTITETLTETVAIDSTTREAHLACSWQAPGADFEFQLRDPGGAVFTPASPQVFHFRGSTHAFYRVSRPKGGLWKIVLRVKKNPTSLPLKITTAALADSDLHCRMTLDRTGLVNGKLRMELAVMAGKRPVVGGRAMADVTFPTISIPDLLKKHASALKDIRIPPGALGRDRVDQDRIKLGVLAAQQAAQSRDIYLRKTVQVPLLDDGKAPDNKAKDGRYTGVFDVKASKVAGSFQIRVGFEARSAAFGTHRCVELLPVYVPERVG